MMDTPKYEHVRFEKTGTEWVVWYVYGIEPPRGIDIGPVAKLGETSDAGWIMEECYEPPLTYLREIVSFMSSLERTEPK